MARAAAPVVPEGRPGAPRSPTAAARLAHLDRHAQIPLLLAAVVPVVVWFVEPRSAFAVAVYVVSWLVFVADFAARAHLTWRYHRSRRGVLDALVVVVTAPWFLIPGFAASRYVAIVRLARLVRILVATRATRRLADRLGRGAAAGITMVLVCSYVAYQAERPVNAGFASYADALWWGVVTITTVGYGDIVPVTAEGRWAAAVLMLSGVGIIGTLAGSLASFFTPGRRRARPGREPPRPAPSPPPGADARVEIEALRTDLRALDERLDRLSRLLDDAG